MKMYQFRAIASFVSAIFLTILSVVLIAWACDSLRNDRDYWKREVAEQERKISNLESTGYMGSMSQGAQYGMGIGFASGVVLAGATGPFSVAVAGPTIAKTTLTGLVGGTLYGAVNHHGELSDARDELDYLKGRYAEAKELYENCLNPPPKYTYTDYNGYVYEFDDYDAYMNFIGNRGH